MSPASTGWTCAVRLALNNSIQMVLRNFSATWWLEKNFPTLFNGLLVKLAIQVLKNLRSHPWGCVVMIFNSELGRSLLFRNVITNECKRIFFWAISIDFTHNSNSIFPFPDPMCTVYCQSTIIGILKYVQSTLVMSWHKGNTRKHSHIEKSSFIHVVACIPAFLGCTGKWLLALVSLHLGPLLD